MDKIFRNIEKLLANNDHAVVPGLGGFVVQHQPAQISGKHIIPPHATISFNPLIHQNDGMLSIEISRENSISYREAATITEKETREFLSKLKKQRKLAFGRIGTFVLENDSRLLFTPANDLTFLPANFGFQKLSLPTKSTISKDIVFTITAKKLMKYAAIFVTFVALLFSSQLNESTNIIRADFSQLNRVDLPEITIIPAIERNDTETTTENTNFKERNSYKVIVAAFDSPEKAKILCYKLRNGDYPDSEIIVTTNNVRVAIRSFCNIISAVNYMEQVRSEDSRFADAWVMKSE